MTKVRKIKRLIALIITVIVVFSMSVVSYADTAPFSTGGGGKNPFRARGYSMFEDVNNDGKNEEVWLQSHYTHFGSGGNVNAAAWSDTITGTYYVTVGKKQMYGWVDKGQGNGFLAPRDINKITQDPIDTNVDMRYFLVVSVNDGLFVPIVNITDSEGTKTETEKLNDFIYDSYNECKIAERRASPMDDNSGTYKNSSDWVYPFMLTLKPGTKYTFAFTCGFVANNGASLILQEDKTADGQSGYTGFMGSGNNYAFATSAEQAEYDAHKNDLYQYGYSFKPLGTSYINPKLTVFDVEFKDFYHTIQTYADLSKLEPVLTDATTFVNGVTDNDYKLGNYRKKSVEALQALITEINSKQMKEELQTSVDSYTDKLTKALAYAKEPAIFVKGISLDKNRSDMTTGDSLTLKAAVTPSNADDQTVTWKSSNENVATVENGVVRALSAGDVIITATSQDGGYTATCAIVVKAPVIVTATAAPKTPAATTATKSTTKSTTQSTTVPSTTESTTTKIETTAAPKSAVKDTSAKAKKSNSALVIIIIAVALILCGSIIVFIRKLKLKKV